MPCDGGLCDGGRGTTSGDLVVLWAVFRRCGGAGKLELWPSGLLLVLLPLRLLLSPLLLLLLLLLLPPRLLPLIS
jgi:hypothetical protein